MELLPRQVHLQVIHGKGLFGSYEMEVAAMALVSQAQYVDAWLPVQQDALWRNYQRCRTLPENHRSHLRGDTYLVDLGLTHLVQNGWIEERKETEPIPHVLYVLCPQFIERLERARELPETRVQGFPG
jgi:hypothetical protein